jgi:hypothetical protein
VLEVYRDELPEVVEREVCQEECEFALRQDKGAVENPFELAVAKLYHARGECTGGNLVHSGAV